MNPEASPNTSPDNQKPVAFAEQLWTEHGWALRGRHILILLVIIGLASLVAELASMPHAPPPTIHASGPNKP